MSAHSSTVPLTALDINEFAQGLHLSPAKLYLLATALQMMKVGQHSTTRYEFLPLASMVAERTEASKPVVEIILTPPTPNLTSIPSFTGPQYVDEEKLHPEWESRSAQSSEGSEWDGQSSESEVSENYSWYDSDEADELPNILDDEFYYPNMSASERIQMKSLGLFLFW
ncbi:hypothetical protein HWV62_10415 [Athelia sp. TMB]|nr:hypothetical protein HWV62_10415 [Athelia sp. TMB]